MSQTPTFDVEQTYLHISREIERDSDRKTERRKAQNMFLNALIERATINT